MNRARVAGLLAKTYRPIVGVLAVAGIIAMLLRERDSVVVLRNATIGSWFVISVLMATNTIIFGTRVKHVIERAGGVRLSWLWWQRVFVNSFALNSVMPQSGAAYRAYELKAAYDLAFVNYVRAYYFIAWLGVLMILLLSTLLLALMSISPIVGGLNAMHVALGAAAALLSAPIVAFQLMPKIIPESGKLGHWRRMLEDTYTFTVECLHDRRFTMKFVLLSVCTVVIDMAILVLSIGALGFVVPLEVAVLIYVLNSVFGLTRITPGNIGVQELVFGVVGHQAGVSVADGIMISLFMRILRVLAVILLVVFVNGLMGMRLLWRQWSMARQ